VKESMELSSKLILFESLIQNTF